MDFIINLYQPFFDRANWVEFFSNPEAWLLLGTLVLMECLLSVDNAVVLAAQTKTLDDPADRRRALTYGLWGAYIFRFIAIGLGTYLIHMWQIKVLGAAYLMYLAVKYFTKKEDSHVVEGHVAKAAKGFWYTVISIELMDLAFSVDAVLASLAVSENPVVILLGGLVGILCMRGIASFIAKLMDKIPELEAMAYFLIFFIGIKLFLSIPMINIHIPASLFAMVVFGAIIVTVAINRFKRVRVQQPVRVKGRNDR